MKSRYPCVYRRGAGLTPRHASSLPRAHVDAATPSGLAISTDDRPVEPPDHPGHAVWVAAQATAQHAKFRAVTRV